MRNTALVQGKVRSSPGTWALSDYFYTRFPDFGMEQNGVERMRNTALVHGEVYLVL